MDAESREKSSLKVLAEASVEKKKEREKRGATRSEGASAGRKDAVREVAGEKERLAERVSSLGAQTGALALNKQGVRSRSSAAWPGRAIANHIPRKPFGREIRSVRLGRSLVQRPRQHLVLPFPVGDVLDPAEPAHVDVFARLDKHVRRGDDEGQGWFAGVLARQPHCDGDVVGCLAIVDGQEAMNAEQELFATVVIGCKWKR